MKNFFNKAKKECRITAMVLVFTLVIMSLEGCGKKAEQTEAVDAVRTIQADLLKDRIQEEPLEQSAYKLNQSFKTLELSYEKGEDYSGELAQFREALSEYQSVYEKTGGKQEDDYGKKLKKAIRTAEKLEKPESGGGEKQMVLLQEMMGETEQVRTYGDELIEAEESETETKTIQSLEAYTSGMEKASSLPETAEAGKETLATEGVTALSDSMKKKAEELKTPLAVYNYLKNYLQYENYYGSRKGAAAAYDAMGGNDVDQAGVLIAMLRYLGYEAVYAEGDIVLDTDQAMALTKAEDAVAAANVLSLAGTKATILEAGGKAAGIKIHHTWARVCVPYGDYRGAGKNAGEKRWIDLDVSLKKYEDTEKNIYQEGACPGIDPETILKEYQEGKTGVLDELLESGTLEEQTQGMYAVRKKIREENLTYLPLSLPYPAEHVKTFEKPAEGICDRITVRLGDCSLGTYTSSELYGKRMVLEYRPAAEEDQEKIDAAGGIFRVAAWQVKMVPVLKVDGETVAEGEAVFLGTTEDLMLEVHSGNTVYASHDRVTAGSLYQFSLDSQSITPAELDQAREEAEAVCDQVTEKNVYTDAYMGVLLKYAGTMYFAQTDIVNGLLAEAGEIVSVRNLSVAVTEYEVSSVSALGRVVGIQEGSLCIDVDMDVHCRTSLRQDDDQCVSSSLLYGMAASRYEDVVWKEFTGQDCVSTMSIFEQAEKEGTALVTLNEMNYNETISRVSADRETLVEVEQAVKKGYTVILPEKETVLNDWRGTGYLILNPETGAGAYRISGGLSGGSTSTAVTIAGVCAVIVLICLMALLAVGIVNLLAFMCAATLGLAAQAVCMLMYILLMESYGGLAVRISNLTEAVKKQAAGDASQEEYILCEFGSSAVELAATVVMMAVFAYIDGRPLKGGGVEEGKGDTGSGGGKEPGSEGSGSGSGDSGGSGTGSGGGKGSGSEGNGSGENGSGSGDSGGSGNGSGGEGKGEVGAGGSESGSKTPSEIAKSWQGTGKYPGIDDYVDVTVEKGTVLYRGEPNGTEYFTTIDAIEQSGRDATKLFEGLQVEKNPIYGYRGEMQGYIFNEDIASAYGIANANPQFGKGGLPQYYVPDVQALIDKGILTLADNIKLNK